MKPGEPPGIALSRLLGSGRSPFCLVAIFCFIFFAATTASVEARQGNPVFDVDVMCVRGDRTTGETRVDLFTKIPVSSLQFITAADGFGARYEVTAQMVRLDEREREQGIAASRIWNSQITVPNFAATQIDTVFDFTSQSVLVQPGRYILRLTLEDQVASRTVRQEIPVEVKDFRNYQTALSDLLVLDGYDSRAGTISPSVSNVIQVDRDNFALFYEVYSRNPQPVRISYEIHRTRPGSVRSGVRSLFGLLRDGRDQQLMEMTFSTQQSVALRAGRNPATLTIPLRQFRVGDYAVRVNVEDERGRVLDSVERLITVRWMGLESFVFQNLDRSIAQLRYVAKRRDIDHIEAAPTREERLMRFREFWARRDPTPNSMRNERMEEYYYRVYHVNRRFGRANEGWLSDRGEVYIRFGEPDNIERQPLRPGGAPAEVWFYNKIGRRFIFVQRSGSQDFELVAPIWDERNRM